jgi:hypothetical protein
MGGPPCQGYSGMNRFNTCAGAGAGCEPEGPRGRLLRVAALTGARGARCRTTWSRPTSPSWTSTARACGCWRTCATSWCTGGCSGREQRGGGRGPCLLRAPTAPPPPAQRRPRIPPHAAHGAGGGLPGARSRPRPRLAASPPSVRRAPLRGSSPSSPLPPTRSASASSMPARLECRRCGGGGRALAAREGRAGCTGPLPSAHSAPAPRPLLPPLLAQSRKRTFIWAVAPGELLPEWPSKTTAFAAAQLGVRVAPPGAAGRQGGWALARAAGLPDPPAVYFAAGPPQVGGQLEGGARAPPCARMLVGEPQDPLLLPAPLPRSPSQAPRCAP